jgi:glycosyltransferase involved in cell wall biosynthesis
VTRWPKKAAAVAGRILTVGVKLISQVNGDGDIIEAWLNHYLRLGVEHFHLVVHGPADENAKLLSIKDSYPITIEATYGGPFDSHEKKRHLDAVLARLPNQWVVVADSDEFVEFPYSDIPETIEVLSSARANLIAAPMLQRVALDGSFISPSVIDDPFKTFPLCSSDLYWKVGIKAEIFKFPLFFCTKETRLLEEGNHNPPLGDEPSETRALGVTHHFKFRRTLSHRLDKRINSAHQFRQESLELREYLGAHSDRLPLEDAFPYSRAELFRRGLLRRLPAPLREVQETTHSPSVIVAHASRQQTPAPVAGKHFSDHSPSAQKTTMFVISRSNEGEECHSYIVEMLRELSTIDEHVALVSFGDDYPCGTESDEGKPGIEVKCLTAPNSFLAWVRCLRQQRLQKVVFCYSWLEAFPWYVGLAAWLAGVRGSFAIQQMMPVGAPPPAKAVFAVNLVRQLFGARARRLARIRVSSWFMRKTVCASLAIRDTLIREYRFPTNRLITVAPGVSTSEFKPCNAVSADVRERLEINHDEFVLVCTAEFTEQKGIELLIHALSRVLRQGIQCKCIMTGDGPLREQHMKKVNSLGLFNYVFFESCRGSAKEYLQAASAFVLPSFWEGLPVALLRAMACGLPCIVTNVGGLPEAVEDKVTGIVVPVGPNSVDAIQEAIEYLATHPCERIEMGKRAREIACQKFELSEKVAELRNAFAE